jgi:formamidopyrimidine-DNA glycosylase
MLLVADDPLPRDDWYSEFGVEPLSEDLDARYLFDMAAVRKSSLKALLMDQGVIAGLGNIYSCEALWQSRLDPRRSAQTLTEEQAGTLVEGVKLVLTEALCVGSASIGHKGDVGRDGYFAHQYKAYGRLGEPCPQADGGLIHKASDKGRSSFYCPVCQT